MTKQALIVTPYLDNLGGGERYMLEASVAIQAAGYHLTFAWDSYEQIVSLAKQFDLRLTNFSTAPQIKKLYFEGSPLAMWRATRAYALVLYLSDGSIPLLGGQKNLIHMQVPYHEVGGRSLWNRLKLSRISSLIVNSQFTKRVVDNEYGTHSVVVYPPITAIKGTQKQKIILSVGRFEPSLNVKRQDALIEAFRLVSPHLPGWRLILAGSCSSAVWLDRLRAGAQGLPIEFVTDGSFTNIKKLYAKSRIYWHATGYGVDEIKNPELTEHFGISVAEAVSAGCIPLVVGRGGIPEIVSDTKYHWQSIEELVSLTKLAVTGALDTLTLPSQLLNPGFNMSIKQML